MSQFYIRFDSEAEARRCRESCDARVAITIMGQMADGTSKVFAGVVQSVEYDPARDSGRRFRVTMHDQIQATKGRPRERTRKSMGTAAPPVGL
jgi:hypothetical protein